MAKAAKKASPTITAVSFSEYAVAPEKAKAEMRKSAVVDSTVTRGNKQLRVRSKHGKKFSFSSVSKYVTCLTCGDKYNASTAPIEPHKYCSRGCEIDDSEASNV